MLAALALTTALSATALSATALAATAPPPEAEWMMDQVTVAPDHRGPVMWRVSKGDAEVWILPSVAVQDGDVWPTGQVEKVISRSQVVYAYSRATLGAGSAISMWLGGQFKMANGRTIEQLMSPEERTRYQATLSALKLKSADYAHWKPAMAAFMIGGAGTQAQQLHTPAATISAIARKYKVPVRPVASYDAKPFVKTLVSADDTQAVACVSAALDDLDWQRDHGRAAGKAWAAGDLRTLKSHTRNSATWSCISRVGQMDMAGERNVRDTVADVKQALDKGGGALFLLGFQSFLTRGGVLDALKSAGYRVDEPELK
jgi:uncharacterized protein YbaP (TraB family)